MTHTAISGFQSPAFLSVAIILRQWVSGMSLSDMVDAHKFLNKSYCPA